MSSLLKLQETFTSNLLGCEGDTLQSLINHNANRERAGIRVYQNNVRSSLTEALADAYPAVKKLVGDGFFKQCTRDYISAYPTTDPILAYYGESFPDFLKDHPGLADHAYLIDVARLERAWLEAYHAADGALLDVTALQELSTDDMPRVRFTLHPSVRLLSSPYPAEKIWRANTLPYEQEDINLDDGPDFIIIARLHLSVNVTTLPEQHFQFLSSLSNGPLSAAVEQALSQDPDFDVQKALQEFFERQVFSHFDLDS